MIVVDPRIGSGELLPLIKAYNVPCSLGELSYGDFGFCGYGPGGSPVTVGIERKTLGDFVSSTMTGRFAGHQLPGLLDPNMGYQDCWLIVEGVWRAGDTGLLEVPAGFKKWKPVSYGSKAFMYKEFESLVLTLEMKAGLRTRYTRTPESTALFLVTLYRWWTDKSLEQHKSHLRFRSQEADTSLLVKPSLARLVAKEFPGVGWERSGQVAGRFPTVYDMVQASEQEWQEVPGIGKTLALRIWSALRGLL